MINNALISKNKNKMNMWDSDKIVQQWLQDNDDASMPLPNLESEPHLLISKVRKHYMEYLIKLLAVNYESNQKLINKNIYLPSAIWRCAKTLEMSAAKSCMIVQLYRQNIIKVIKELKDMTKKGKLYKQLYTCLRVQPENEKKTQANMVNESGCNCQCSCGLKKNRPNRQQIIPPDKMSESIKSDINSGVSNSIQPKDLSKLGAAEDEITKTDKETQQTDNIMQQLEELFQGIPDDDDIFEGILDTTPLAAKNSTSMNNTSDTNQRIDRVQPQPNLDDRLTALSGLITNIDQESKTCKDKMKQHRTSKWLCEEYFLKVQLYEKLDEIRENKRLKFVKIKNTIIELFGYDSDEEGLVSPIDETPEFILSCKERITPWVVKILSPYYIKGRIRGKTLFKSLARHLIKLIYQCSKYPFEYEVQSFVQDFLASHKMITCEADFEGFRIENA